MTVSPDPVKWSDGVSAVAAAVSALVSIGALVAAVIAALAAWKTFRKQEEQIRALESDKQQGLASRFTVWLEEIRPGAFVVKYTNAGPLPVFNVNLLAPQDSGGAIGFPLNTLPPTTEPQILNEATAWLITAIRHPELCIIGVRKIDGELLRVLATDDKESRRDLQNVALVAYFRDANNRHWIRDEIGMLIPAESFNNSPRGPQTPPVADVAPR